MYQSAKEFIEIISEKKKSRKITEGDFYRLLDDLNHPEKNLVCLHVAGTNGKGSTTNYLRSILQVHGYRVGSFTSPHLEVHNDRIRINDENISDEDLLRIANDCAAYFEKYDLSMFEIDMIISLIYFNEQKVDYVVYEVGMGGRIDSTNIITPLVSIITNIGFDHMMYLGDTLDKIAYEKAGIIKEQVPAFTAENKKICLDVFYDEAKKKHTSMSLCRVPKGRLEDNKLVFDYLGYQIHLDTIAMYQVKNAALALKVAEYLRKNHIIPLERKKIQQGLEQTFWKGRFEILQKQPLVICDGAHNEHGVRAILDSVLMLRKPICIIASILKDKEHEKMLQMLKEVSDELVVTVFENSRSSSLEELKGELEATAIADYKEAIEYALSKYQNGSILLTGSLYFVSEIREYFRKNDRDH